VVDHRFVRRPRDSHFFTPPEHMVFTHRPAHVEWQLLSSPVTLGDYTRFPVVPRDFWSLGFDAGRLRRAAESGMRGGLVGAFPDPARPIRVLDAPLQGELERGSRHTFRIQAPSATEVIAITGNHWQPLRGAGGTFAGEAVVDADRLVIMLRYPDRPSGIVMLEYRSPEPAGRNRRHR
jgi:hypothetical protein